MRKQAILRSRFLHRVSAVVLLGAVFTLSCADESVEVRTIKEQTAEQTIRATIDAFNEGDTAAFLGHWTDEGLEAEFGYSREEIAANPEQFFVAASQTFVRIGRFRDIFVYKDVASVEFDFIYGEVVTPQRYSLVIQDDAWKIIRTEELQARLPPGSTRVHVNLKEFAFEFDQNAIPPNNFAFEMQNQGSQPHEAVLLRAPEDYTIQQLFESETPDLPEGVSFVGAVGPFEPGERGNMVFSERPAPGVYMLLCFLPDTADPAGTPHAFKGMAVRFRVP